MRGSHAKHRGPRTQSVWIGLLSIAAASCGGDAPRLPTNSGESSAAVARLSERVRDLEAALARAEPRAAKMRCLEFLGFHPPMPGDVTTVEIVATSPTPDPKTSQYADCIVVHHAKRVGVSPGDAVPDEFLLAGVAFRGRQRLLASFLLPGDRVEAILAPWSAMGPADALQRSDTIDRVELPMFAALGLHRERELTRHDVATERTALEWPTQRQSIAQSLREHQARLARHGTWKSWQRQLRPIHSRLGKRIEDNGGAPLTLDDRITFRHPKFLAPRTRQDWPAPQVRVLSSLRDQLGSMGIELIVVPFPEKEHVVCERFLEAPPTDSAFGAQRERLLLHLLEAGIEVVDLRPALVRALDEFEHVYYDGQDGHPADGAVQVSAAVVAERLGRYGLKRHLRTAFTAEVRHGVAAGTGKFPPRAFRGDAYAATVVLDGDRRELPRSEPSSEVLVFGDSFIGVPGSYGVLSADFCAHLALRSGVIPRRLQVEGGAPQLMVHLARAGRELTEGCRVCIVAIRESYLYSHTPDDPTGRWDVRELPSKRD